MNRQAIAVERAQQRPSVPIAPPGSGIEPWPARPAQRGHGPADLLLGDHDRVEERPATSMREAAELADRVAHPVEQLGVLANEELRAEGRCRPPRRPSGTGSHRRAGAAPPPSARMNAASIIATPPFMSSAPRPQTKPSWTSPPNGGWRHSPRAATTSTCPWSSSGGEAPSPRQPRDQVRPLGLARHDLHLTAELLQQPADPLDALALVARRVRRVEAQQLREQLSGLLVQRALRGRRRRAHGEQCRRSWPCSAVCARG